MKTGLYLFLTTLIVISCTKLSIDENISIEWEQLHPKTINSSLDRVNIITDQDSFDIMINAPYVELQSSAEIQYYSSSGEIILDESSVIEMRGSASLLKDMKSVGITFNKRINNEQLNILSPPIINAHHNLNNLKTIRLRNSGQDYGTTMIKDLAYTEFALRCGLNLEVKYGKPVHAFINEKYYGLLNLRSESDPSSLADILQTSSENLTTIKMDDKNGKLEYKSGDETLANTLIQAIKDEDVWTLRSIIDMENFMDYIIFQDYIGNVDWPAKNLRMYSNGGAPFKFILYDLDYAAYQPKEHVLPEMEFQDDHMSRMFQVFMEYDNDFEKALEERQEMWYDVFSPERFNEIVDELASNIEGDMKYFIARRNAPSTTFEWRINLEKMKRDFERTDHHKRKKYNLN